MVTKRMVQGGSQNNFPVDPTTLPDDGSPVTFEQTFRKKVGDGSAGVGLTVDDFDTADWQIERQTDSGWAAIDVIQGRPHKPELREVYGEGKYRIMPLDPRDRKPMDSLHRIELIGSPVLRVQAQHRENTPAPQNADGDLPPWMRLMLSQQAQERADAIRRAEDTEARRIEWEQKQTQREWDRVEREERERRAREDRELEERRSAADRNNALLLAGLGIAEKLFSARQQPTQPEDSTKEVLLAALLRERDRPEPAPAPAGSMKESLELLMVLDRLAESRAERNAPPPAPEPEEENLGKTFMGMLPMLVAARSGGGGAAAVDPDALRAMTAAGVKRVLADPDVIAQYASADPEGIAKVFLQAVKKNPKLEQAVVKALDEDRGDDGEGDRE